MNEWVDTRQPTESERRLKEVASGRRGIGNHRVPRKEEFMGRTPQGSGDGWFPIFVSLEFILVNLVQVSF